MSDVDGRPGAGGPGPRALAPSAAARALACSIVLDARGPDTFAAGHLPGAGRMTLGEFATRRAELPPRTAAVLVVHDDPAAARAAAEALATLAYPDTSWLDAPLAALAAGHADFGPAAPLWRASPFLARVTPRLPRPRALDLACGAGRESVHLALHGFRVEAWDHDPVALAIARDLAARHDVRIETRCVELLAPDLPPPPQPWDAIVVCRFLHRPLFAWIERALAPGGMLVYETFRRGQEAYGHPRSPRFLLEPGELASAFATLRVEAYEESTPRGGPIMAHLLARAPAGA